MGGNVQVTTQFLSVEHWLVTSFQQEQLFGNGTLQKAILWFSSMKIPIGLGVRHKSIESSRRVFHTAELLSGLWRLAAGQSAQRVPHYTPPWFLSSANSHGIKNTRGWIHVNPEVSDELRMCVSVAAAARSASHTRELPESESELNGSNAFVFWNLTETSVQKSLTPASVIQRSSEQAYTWDRWLDIPCSVLSFPSCAGSSNWISSTHTHNHTPTHTHTHTNWPKDSAKVYFYGLVKLGHTKLPYHFMSKMESGLNIFLWHSLRISFLSITLKDFYFTGTDCLAKLMAAELLAWWGQGPWGPEIRVQWSVFH